MPVVIEQGPEDALASQLTYAGIEFIRQYRYAAPRRYKADFYIPAAYLLIEVDGGVGRGDIGHTSVKGIMNDMERTNLATLHGYGQLRFHAKQIEDGEALTLIEQVIGRAT